MFVAMPSSDSTHSWCVRNQRSIVLRTINNDQRSPSISTEAFSGHHNSRLGVGLLLGTFPQ